MDVAYDHIQEESLPKEEEIVKSKENAENGETSQSEPTLNTEFKEAWGAVTSSPWAATLGGLWGTVRKTGEQYYEEASKTTSAASTQASKGINTLITRTRGLSLANSDNNTIVPSKEKEDEQQQQGKGEEEEGTYKIKVPADSDTGEGHPERPDSLPADIVKEAQTLVTRFRSEAAKRLKDIERAEDAADEALLRFGTNIKNFLQEAVSIAPPTEIIGADSSGSGSKVLFESKDAEGKRVIHTNRLDAQLHVIHCSADGFLKDPAGPEYEAWEKEFDITAKTDAIAADLEKYDELRRAMEKVVPEKVEYAIFWKRYYFLRRVAELEEQRRKDLLKGAASNAEEEQIGWDDEEDDTQTPNAATESTHTLKSTEIPKKKLLETPKPLDIRSQADSEASYDIISATTSKAGGSPREKKIDESDEEDWE